MGKIKFKKLRFGNYFRELSIVIIGVAITLMASSIISSLQEKNDLKQQMDTIYMELEDNYKRVETLVDFYTESRNLQKLLLKDFRDPGKIPEDSIRKYNNHIIGKVKTFVYKRNAYNMFVTTGDMKAFKDKKLLLDISEAYALLEAVKESHKEQMGLLIQLFNNIFSMDTKKVIDRIDIREFPSIYNFYMMTSGDLEMALETQQMIEKIIANK